MDGAVKAKAKITGKKAKKTWVKGHYKKGSKSHTKGHFRKVGMLADEVEYRLRDGVVEPFAADYSGNGEKTFQTVIIESNRLPLFMVDVWLEKPEIEILQNVVESF